MSTLKAKYIGSEFEQFLIEDGTLDEATAVAVKRVLAWQITEAMKAQSLTKSRMAKLMRTSRSSLDRLLDEEATSLTLTTLVSAAQALGKRVSIELVSV